MFQILREQRKRAVFGHDVRSPEPRAQVQPSDRQPELRDERRDDHVRGAERGEGAGGGGGDRVEVANEENAGEVRGVDAVLYVVAEGGVKWGH